MLEETLCWLRANIVVDYASLLYIIVADQCTLQFFELLQIPSRKKVQNERLSFFCSFFPWMSGCSSFAGHPGVHELPCRERLIRKKGEIWETNEEVKLFFYFPLHRCCMDDMLAFGANADKKGEIQTSRQNLFWHAFIANCHLPPKSANSIE